MNSIRYTFVSLAFFLSFQLAAQMDNAIADLNFKLQLMDDNKTIGLFVVPGSSANISKKANTGSGQVTLVAPVGFSYAGLKNYSGTWVENARVDGPMESPDKAYISFGFVADEPRIKYEAGKEVLLFSFVPDDSDAAISLIDNVNDPFSAPNTYGSNPGNDLGVIDFDRDGNMLVFAYGKNLDQPKEQPRAVFANNKNNETAVEYKAVFASEKIATPSN